MKRTNAFIEPLLLRSASVARPRKPRTRSLALASTTLLLHMFLRQVSMLNIESVAKY